MTRHAILNANDHRDVRVRTDASAELGDGLMACVTVPAEFRRLQGDFPILFRRNDDGALSALVLLGFEPGENLFLDGGRWDAGSKPLAMSIQPFLIGRAQDEDGPGQVHIDMAHPRIAENGEGVRLFDDAGQPSPFVEDAAAMLGALDQGFREAPGFFAALDRYGLTEPFSMDVAMDDGGQHRLVGYELISEEKLRALDAGPLAELHAAGYLEPVFMALASIGRLNDLVRRKQRRDRG